jgi:hypothetical protein
MALFGGWYVKVEDEVAFLGRDELFPNELKRARTPKGKPSLELERPEPAIRPADLSPIGRYNMNHSLVFIKIK